MAQLTLNELLKDYDWGIGDKPINACKCNKCDTILVSLYRHDFQKCKCGNFTDGGFDYVRRGTVADSEIVELPDFSEQDIKDLRAIIARRYDARHK